MCFIGLHAQNMVVLGPEVNIICRDLYDHLMSMKMFTLILIKDIILALKIKRKVATIDLCQASHTNLVFHIARAVASWTM
jgi:hypothetical protein